MKSTVQVWSLEEEIIVAKEYGKSSVREIADKTNKKMSQVYSKIQKMKQKGLIEDKKDFKLKKNTKEKEAKKTKEGLDLSKLKLDKHKKYRIDRRKKGGYGIHLKGYIVQETREHLTFRSEAGYCESFRKADLLIGEYRVKEI